MPGTGEIVVEGARSIEGNALALVLGEASGLDGGILADVLAHDRIGNDIARFNELVTAGAQRNGGLPEFLSLLGAPPGGNLGDVVDRTLDGGGTDDNDILDPVLQDMLRNSGTSIRGQLNDLEAAEINRALSNQQAFNAIYNHTNSDKQLNLWVDFREFDDVRHLTKGVQDYVTWATGLTANSILPPEEQALNRRSVGDTLGREEFVAGALERESVTNSVLSGATAGVGMNPTLWSLAPAGVLVELKGTRGGTRGVGDALLAKGDLTQLRDHFPANVPDRANQWLRRFDSKAMNFGNGSLLNGWEGDVVPADGGSMRAVMLALPPDVLASAALRGVDGVADLENRNFIVDALDLQVRERPNSEMRSIAEYARGASNERFVESLLNDDNAADVGRIINQYITSTDQFLTEDELTRTNSQGLSLFDAMGEALESCPAEAAPGSRSLSAVPDNPQRRLCLANQPMRNAFVVGNLAVRAIYETALSQIARLGYQAGQRDIFGSQGTIVASGNGNTDVRIDVQSTNPLNIQIQMQNVRGRSTIANVIVPSNLLKAISEASGETKMFLQRQAMNIVKQGLNHSLSSWLKTTRDPQRTPADSVAYELDGSFSPN